MSKAVGYNLGTCSLTFRRLLVVIKQTAFEEYTQVGIDGRRYSQLHYLNLISSTFWSVACLQLKLRGMAPKALRWKRLESRYNSHKQCVDDLMEILRSHKVDFNCVNRTDLDRQHLANVDLVIAVGGDGTVLSAAHFLDHGTIPLLGINVRTMY